MNRLNHGATHVGLVAPHSDYLPSLLGSWPAFIGPSWLRAWSMMI